MELTVVDSYQEMSVTAAGVIAGEIARRPDCVLGLATGATPVGTYHELVNLYRHGRVDFSHVKTFNLDEYYPIDPRHPQSYTRFVWEHLFSRINIRPENVHLPRGNAPDAGEECRRYEAAIDACGGIDLQVLGIGRNGHIGFNEPGTSLGSSTQLVRLAEETVKANSRFFDRWEDVPRFAISMGIKTIMRSRRILLLASGEGKAEILARAMEGPVTSAVPASVLQLHPSLAVIADRGAAAGLSWPRVHPDAGRRASWFLPD